MTINGDERAREEQSPDERAREDQRKADELIGLFTPGTRTDREQRFVTTDSEPDHAAMSLASLADHIVRKHH